MTEFAAKPNFRWSMGPWQSVLMCADNKPSGSAMKMGDVLTIRGGKTVEIFNTDAEGHLALADAPVLGGAITTALFLSEFWARCGGRISTSRAPPRPTPTRCGA